MRYVYVTALIDFRITEKLRTPLQIKPGLYLTNNPEHVAAYTNTYHLLTVGTLEARLLTDGSPVLYKLDELKSPQDAQVETVNFLREVQGFLTAMWLTQDNSVNCELAFALSQELMHAHSNALALSYTCHDGTRKVLEVDLKEVSTVIEIHAKSFQGIREQDRPKHTAFRKTISRVDRAMNFLQQARSADDLGQKIANYCSFFECLLSTSSAELSHQLSERAAFFLTDDPADRLRIFRDMKKAYGVRSKIVHGDILSPNAISGLVQISKHCDDTARALVRKILHHPVLDDLMTTGSNEALDAHMFDLIFGLRKTVDNGIGTVGNA
jgi:hypothetical protein